MLIYFIRKKEYIGAAYGISRNVSPKLSRSTNHPFHGHNFSNSDLYTFALQAKGSPPLLACFPKADFEPTRSEASFIPSLCEARLPSGPQFVSTARSTERAFLSPSFHTRNRAQVSCTTMARLRTHRARRRAARALSPFPIGFRAARNLAPQEPIMDGT